MGQERSRPRPPWVAGRCVPAVPPSQRRTPCRIPGRGPAGGQGRADSTHGQGRPQECSVDLRVWPD
eukprot:4128675-Alexandrium_andersonii.AAC.1